MRFVRLHGNSNVNDLHRILRTEPCFVKFFAPWCGYCKLMKNDWDALEHSTPKNINVTILEVENSLNEHLPPHIRQHVRGYPTIMKIDKGGHEQTMFSGNRTTGDMLNFIKHNFSHVHKLDAKKKTRHAKKNAKSRTKKNAKSRTKKNAKSRTKKKTRHTKKKTRHAKKKTKSRTNKAVRFRTPTPYP